MNYCLPIQTKIGLLYAISRLGKLIRLAAPEEINPMEKMLPGEDIPVLRNLKIWMSAYNEGSALPLQDIPVDPDGTDFQKAVWKILLQIPFGKSVSYGSIAREMEIQMGIEKMSAQAVGAAVGKNPIPIVIPCHRVLGAKSTLTGFRYGLHNKITLLNHEGISYKK